MKICKQCGAEDNPVIETVPSNAGEMEQVERHFVRPEIQYLKPGEEISPRQQRQGWIQRVFQGRQAIERDICINCLNSNHIRKQLSAEQHKKAMQLERDQEGEENFYLLLTDADGMY